MVVTHEPKTFAELQKFYTDVYTPLYDRFINSGAAVGIADAARPLERRSRDINYSSWDAAFEKWQELLPIADYFIALLTDKTVVRAVAKSRRQKVISVVIWLLGIVLGALLGKLF